MILQQAMDYFIWFILCFSKILGEHPVAFVVFRLSVHPSLYLLNLLSEIDVVDNILSLKQGLVNQCLSG
jgi:hypothetical protein